MKESIFSWNGLMLGLFSVLIGIFLIVMPKYSDDYWYMSHFVDWFASQGIHDATEGGNIFTAGIPWGAVAETWHEHLTIDNIRLGNLLVTLFLLLPKWVGSSLVTLGWVYSMLCSLKIAGVDFRKSALVALAIILWGAFVPWADRMGSEVFQFNYFLATAISLLLLSLLGIGKDRNSPIGGGLLGKAGLFIVACMAGWWHEGFSIPLFTGLLSLVVFCRECRTRNYITALCGLAAGIIIIASAPGTGSRLELSAFLSWDHCISMLRYALVYNIAFFGLVVLVFISAKKYGWRDTFRDKRVTMALVSGMVPIMISAVTYSDARVMWWTQIISIMAILTLLARLKKDYWSRYRMKNAIWLIPVVTLTFVHFAVSDYYVFKMRDAQADSIKSYFANPDRSVFADVILPVDQPLICLRMPEVIFYSSGSWHLSFFVRKQTGKGEFFMIPKELRDIDSTSGRPIEGEFSVREYKNRLFMPYDVFEKANKRIELLEIDYGSGYSPVPYWGYEFESERDGKKYVYLCIYNSWYSQHFKTIKGLRLINKQANN